MHRLCAVIPVRDQEFTITDVVTRLIVAGLDCVLVDDGATPECAEVLDRLTRQDRIFLARSRVRGDALLAGLREAQQLGYTHALHVAADGRNDLSDIPKFARQSAAAPDALICGYRVTDTPVRAVWRARDRAAWLLGSISTLSFALRDPNGTFRLYPLGPVLDLARDGRVGRWLRTDLAILVRMRWRRRPMYWLPVTSRPTSGPPARSSTHLEHA